MYVSVPWGNSPHCLGCCFRLFIIRQALAYRVVMLSSVQHVWSLCRIWKQHVDVSLQKLCSLCFNIQQLKLCHICTSQVSTILSQLISSLVTSEIQQGYNCPHIEAMLVSLFGAILLHSIHSGCFASVRGQAATLAHSLHLKHIPNMWKLFLTKFLLLNSYMDLRVSEQPSPVEHLVSAFSSVL